MAHPNHKIARDFFTAFFAGEMTEDFLTEDMSAWTTLGPLDRMSYIASVKQVVSLFRGPNASFKYVIDAMTAEDDRVVTELHSSGNFEDGEPYEMDYVFVLRVRDGKVASVAEHFNPIPVLEKVFPRMKQAPATVA